MDMERSKKRTKLLDEGSDEEIETSEPVSGGFKINEEFAKRFEHNKKREEIQRLEEKFAGTSSKRKRDVGGDTEDEESSTDESEDDDALLATVDVDDEIMATLQAIKNKDPRVYDAKATFYKEFDPETAGENMGKKDKPMYLQDYHRHNLLAGKLGEEEEEEHDEPRSAPTYQEAQDQLKRELVESMHAQAPQQEDDQADFMVAKRKPKHDELPMTKIAKSKNFTEHDIEQADKDPETYLSNFMAARAWLPGEGPRFQAFESDDSEDERRADEFEEAYNLRFEDPAMANEKLQSFARDVGKYGVRREEKTGRQNKRGREREKKEAEKIERQEEKARLRKLKVEEAQEKVKRIKEAAGLGSQELDLEEWRDVIEGDFDDDRWEQEMQRRFGDKYYAEDDADFDSDQPEGYENKTSKPSKPKRPKWNDDIDIKDLVPDFDDGDKPEFTLSSDEDGEAMPSLARSEDDAHDGSSKNKPKTKKDREKEKIDARRAARKERQKIEEIVDAGLPLQEQSLSSSAAARVGFRYRATSPTSFGLSARDILFADDARLNEFAGLKKMAAFRDPEKKRRDKKKYSKKGRLRQWRKETFGKPDEPIGGFERILGDSLPNEDAGGPIPNGETQDGAIKKKKRSNKRKTPQGESADAS